MNIVQKRLAGFGYAMSLITSLIFMGPASAGTATDTFLVTATVLSECSITANDLAFGNYSVTAGTQVDASTTISVQCSGGTAYDVALDAGSGSGASVSTRKMSSGTNTLDYSLYQDSSRTQVWGETSGSDTVSGTGTGSAEVLNVYGRIVASQAAAAGSYSDTVTATVSF